MLYFSFVTVFKQMLSSTQSRKLQESGWTPRWFQQDSVNDQYRYIGGYWEARGLKKWDGCPNIFEDICVQ